MRAYTCANMPHTTLVTGDLSSLEDELTAAVGALRAAGDPLAPVTVLVGHVLLRPYLRRLLARRGVPLLNVRFLRPNELASDLAKARSHDGASPSPRLSAAADRLLVREIAEEAQGYFEVVAGREGFAKALHRLFREIELGGFTPEGFTATAASHGAKQAELARLYARYRERRGGFASIAEEYASALAQTPETPLLVYGLWQPAMLQWRLIEHWARTAGATVFLPSSGLDADEAHEEIRRRLLALPGATQRDVSHRDAPTLAERIFRAPSGDPPAGTPATTLTNAPDTVREIWEAARACLRWAGEGIRFHEMAIVYKHREPYRALIDEIFSEAGIDTYLHDGRLLSAHPLGRRLLMLLSLAEQHETFERVPVMEFLAETLLPRETRDRLPPFRPAEWETYTRQAGVVEGIAQWRQRLDRLANEMAERAQDERFAFLASREPRIREFAAFIDEFHGALAARPDVATWDEHLAFLRGLCERYADGTQPLLDALSDLKTLAAVRDPVPFTTFADAVRDDLASRDASRVLNEPVRLFGRVGVAVIDASSLRHLRFRAVCLVGVSERSWPPPLRPDPLLLEDERASINQGAGGQGAGGELPLRTEPDDEALAFWLALQSAQEHLSVSYARADAGRSGRHLPSYFYRAVVEALEGRGAMALDELDASPHVTRFEAGRLASRDLSQSLSQAEYDRGLIRAANEDDLRGAIEAIEQLSPSFASARVARSHRRSHALTAYDGLMLSAAAIEAARARSPFSQGKAVSPSRLETYASCAYQYFLRNTLGIEPVEEPERIERIDHLQKGSLIHDILQTFLERIAGDPPSPERRADHLRILQEVADEAGADRVARGVTGRALVWRMDKKAIDEDLARWYDEEVKALAGTTLRPRAFEARFGPVMQGFGRTDPNLYLEDPLELRTPSGRVIRVQGRIDRIDVDAANTKFKVIDYKTGKSRPGRNERLHGGESLQLPIYLHAAAEMLGLPPEAGHTEYFYASSAANFSRHGFSGTQVQEEMAAGFWQTLDTIAAGADSGYFVPEPGKPRCNWCDYRAVCDVSIDRIMKAKQDDPRRSAYAAMKDLP